MGKAFGKAFEARSHVRSQASDEATPPRQTFFACPADACPGCGIRRGEMSRGLYGGDRFETWDGHFCASCGTWCHCPATSAAAQPRLWSEPGG